MLAGRGTANVADVVKPLVLPEFVVSTVGNACTAAAAATAPGNMPGRKLALINLGSAGWMIAGFGGI